MKEKTKYGRLIGVVRDSDERKLTSGCDSMGEALECQRSPKGR